MSQIQAKFKLQRVGFVDITPELKDGVKIPRNYSPRRKWWYRTPEREKIRVPVDKSLIGKRIRFNRFIIRVGYFFEHTDVQSGDLSVTISQLMAAELINALGKHAPPLEKAIQVVKHLRNKWGYGLEYFALREARDLWVNAAYRLPEFQEHRGRRAFWYINVEDVDPDSFKEATIIGVRGHWTGKYYPALTDHWSGEWESGGLSEQNYQQVYVVDNILCRNYDDYFDGYNIRIHPADVNEVIDV